MFRKKEYKYFYCASLKCDKCSLEIDGTLSCESELYYTEDFIYAKEVILRDLIEVKPVLNSVENPGQYLVLRSLTLLKKQNLLDKINPFS